VTNSTEPPAITNNLFDETLNAGETGYSNSDIRLTGELGNLSNVTVSGNYLFGAGFTFETEVANYTISNVSVTNNVTGFATYSQYYPGRENTATVSGNTTVDFSDPTDSTNALATYVAAGVPTANVFLWNLWRSGRHRAGADDAVGQRLCVGAPRHVGSGETNFVGGYGEQLLFGGQGANVLTYLALGDDGDLMAGFDPAKDVIDLSRIDGDIITPGLQNFTFIGSAPFNGAGAEVSYQLNPTSDTTTVQAALAGDITADFSITLEGFVPLTAANFALTPSQSTAALANGAALTHTKVTTPAGAPTEYAYSNVQGRAYTTYESFHASQWDLAADDLNFSSNQDKLVIYDPSQTVMRGGGAETLTVGTGSDPISYHPIETIDATTSGSEQFIFSAGFGKETIDGFSPSGASPDSIQLAKSAFSYLTARRCHI
jgi:hypothetical protein